MTSTRAACQLEKDPRNSATIDITDTKVTLLNQPVAQASPVTGSHPNVHQPWNARRNWGRPNSWKTFTVGASTANPEDPTSDSATVDAVNVVLCPNFEFMGPIERVPGAKQVPCLVCSATLTATPTSLEAAGEDGGFLCKECGVRVLAHARNQPLGRPKGAVEELTAAGLGDIARNDTELLHRLQGALGQN